MTPKTPPLRRSAQIIPFVRKSKPAKPKFASGYDYHGSFGKVDRYGTVHFGQGDWMEVTFLATLSEMHGHYVFKRVCGTYGYLNEHKEFVPVVSKD